jgi:hypothetical protein
MADPKTVYLYAVHANSSRGNPVLERVTAVERAKTYKIQGRSSWGFRCRSVVVRDEACLSKSEAVLRWHADLDKKIEAAERALAALRTQRAAAVVNAWDGEVS